MIPVARINADVLIPPATNIKEKSIGQFKVNYFAYSNRLILIDGKTILSMKGTKLIT